MLKEIVNKAYNYSKDKHKGQVRYYTKLEYFTHPKAVARIIERLFNDEIMVAAALLHDVLEDTETSCKQLHNEFGQEVADLVVELTNNKNILKEKGKTQYLIDKIDNMSSRARSIKLADRLHNIMHLREDIDKYPIKFIAKLVKETESILLSIEEHNLDLAQQSLYYKILSEVKAIKFIRGLG
jgi:(p)ppGpp synthase/HD superfamily hydrolase